MGKSKSWVSTNARISCRSSHNERHILDKISGIPDTGIGLSSAHSDIFSKPSVGGDKEGLFISCDEGDEPSPAACELKYILHSGSLPGEKEVTKEA